MPTRKMDMTDPLDVLPKLVARAPPGPAAPALPSSFAAPIMLMGLVSASKPRRDALRCTWVRTLVATGGARVLFVVGRDEPDLDSADVLSAPIAEQLLARRGRGSKIKTLTSYSTYSLYFKTMHFLRHASSQPEPTVVLGDDDIFVQPHALLRYAWTLLTEPRREGSPLGTGGGEWYAGRFDWYSWRTELMMATAYWRGLRGAIFGAQEIYRVNRHRHHTPTKTRRTAGPCSRLAHTRPPSRRHAACESSGRVNLQYKLRVRR